MELQGHFVGNVPQQIQADWNSKYACLAGFPLNILYTRLRLPVALTACYWFDPAHSTRMRPPSRWTISHGKKVRITSGSFTTSAPVCGKPSNTGAQL